jgi:hypothetical protein
LDSEKNINLQKVLSDNDISNVKYRIYSFEQKNENEVDVEKIGDGELLVKISLFAN